MTFPVSESIRTLAPYIPGKPIAETQREFGVKRVIKLASNENPLGPSPQARRVLAGEFKELHRYPDSAGYLLKNALSKHLSVSPQEIILGNGSNDVIDLLIRTFSEPGDQMVTSEGAFIAYRICAQIHGVQTLEVPLNGQLKFEVSEMLHLVQTQERVRLVFVANPNNPTGTWLNAEELIGLLEGVSRIRNGSVMVVLDYAYWEYVTSKEILDPIPLLKKYPQLVVLRTFSKVYGLAGLRLGYGVASTEIISLLEKVRQPFNINSFALAAGVAALKDRAFVKRAKAANSQGLKYWEKVLSQLEVPFWKSQGNFILAEVSGGGVRTAQEVNLACLKQGVIFRPVANYGLKNHLRISVGTMKENEIAARALARALGRVWGKKTRRTSS